METNLFGSIDTLLVLILFYLAIATPIKDYQELLTPPHFLHKLRDGGGGIVRGDNVSNFERKIILHLLSHLLYDTSLGTNHV